jgi:hypothetical protein
MTRPRFATLAVLLVALTACASATPATPVTTIDQLVGKWKGTVSAGRMVDPIWLTINADRSLIAIWGSITARGTVTISGGQASYQMAPPIQEGTLKLYTDKGKPQITMESMSGAFYATVEPDS